MMNLFNENMILKNTIFRLNIYYFKFTESSFKLGHEQQGYREF